LAILEDFFSLDWLFLIVIAPFIGSFLGVLATRVPKGQPAVRGRSACPTCGHQLAARDLIPVLSWVLQRRRCRYCGTAIDLFYPSIELGAVLIAAAASWRFSGWLLWVSCGLGWTLLLIAAIDYLCMVIPDKLTFPLIAAGLAVAYVADYDGIARHALGAAVGFLAFAGLGWFYRWFRGRDGLGLGDAKLLGASGSWVSITGLPSVVLLSAVAALLAVFMAALAGRQVYSDDKLPFGTYLCLGTYAVWLLGPLG